MITISEAARLISEGKVVAFPTETVYGLGANAFDEEACKKIYTIKGRPNFNPLIVHVSSVQQAAEIVEFNQTALKLTVLMPGPITLVLPRKPNINIAKTVSAGLDTLAIRIPSAQIALELITLAGVPIAAPSANKSNYISATRPWHVKHQFTQELASGEISLLEGTKDEHCYGLESTIIDCSDENRLVVLRNGFILPATIEKITDKTVTLAKAGDAIKAPGMLDKHYSPAARVRLNATDFAPSEFALLFGSVLPPDHNLFLNLSPAGDVVEAASKLYDYLHRADHFIASHPTVTSIAISPIPDEHFAIAINDRLKRAASE